MRRSVGKKTSKLKDWQHEREYRVTLYSLIGDFTNRESGKLRYRCQDLQGIIFGLRTSLADKVAIFRLIQDKCQKLGRKDFEFLQMYYSRRTGKIAMITWQLLKLG